MIIKNIRLAFRNIIRYPGISSINIIGLATGMMAALLIFQYIRFEKSFDHFLDKSDRICRLVFYRFYATGLDKSVGNNFYVGEIAGSQVPEIEQFCRVKKETVFIEAEEQIYKEERVLFADSSFFDIFSHRLIAGDETKILRQPGGVVITESLARKYFGSSNPIGKIIYSVNPGKRPVTVTGVIEDVPQNTHLRFDMVVPLSTIINKSYCYSCNNTNTYFLLKEGADISVVDEKITSLAKQNYRERGVVTDFPIEYHLQPVTDIHLHSAYRFEFEVNGNSRYITMLVMIAFLIMASAGLNYFNLFTAITTRRMKGTGIRMVNGASRTSILSEFVTESLLTGLIGFFIALIMLFFFFPLLKRYLNLTFGFDSVFQAGTLIIPVITLIVISFLTGFLTAMKLIRSTPVSFLKKETIFKDRKLPGMILLTLQFIIAVTLITASLIAVLQIDFMKKEAMTMAIDQTLVIKGTNTKEFMAPQLSFIRSLEKIPGVELLTYSTISPGEKNNWVKGGIALKGEPKLGYQFFQMDVAPNFFDFFRVKLLDGRQFFSDETNWSGGPRHLILNREAAAAFGKGSFSELIGQTLYDSDNKEEIGDIVGIIDGYFQNSLDQEVRPTIFNCDQAGSYLFIRIKPGNIQATVEKITTEFKTYYKGQFLEYFFLDDYFNSQYKSHTQLFRCFFLFSLMAIIITMLSLYGLVTMTSGARTKEIGIRKLNGSRVSEIIIMLNKEILLLVLISLVAAAPLTWFLMNRWLNNFAYRIELSWWIFAVSGLMTLLIVVLAISRESLKAAMLNPVEALRYE